MGASVILSARGILDSSAQAGRSRVQGPRIPHCQLAFPPPLPGDESGFRKTFSALQQGISLTIKRCCPGSWVGCGFTTVVVRFIGQEVKTSLMMQFVTGGSSNPDETVDEDWKPVICGVSEEFRRVERHKFYRLRLPPLHAYYPGGRHHPVLPARSDGHATCHTDPLSGGNACSVGQRFQGSTLSETQTDRI